MTIGRHMTKWGGAPVRAFHPGETFDDRVAWRVGVGWDEADRGLTVSDKLKQLAEAAGDRVTHLVIGAWSDAYEAGTEAVVATLVELAPRWPRLAHLFVGDMTYEECEISWIHQADLAPLLAAYPRLESLGARGGTGLRLSAASHAHLKRLVLETGGMNERTQQDVVAADLPALEDLELWLGTANYGYTGKPSTLSGILDGRLFPTLKRLALRNADISDDLAVRLASSPVLERLTELDLSLGTLSDRGAEALLGSERVASLESLVLDHHYLSDAMMERVFGLPMSVSAADPQEPSKWGMFVAVGE